jgi:hypothetical protein
MSVALTFAGAVLAIVVVILFVECFDAAGVLVLEEHAASVSAAMTIRDEVAIRPLKLRPPRARERLRPPRAPRRLRPAPLDESNFTN